MKFWSQNSTYHKCSNWNPISRKIRVFFKDSQEAKNFNYSDYDEAREKDGYIYAFTGLRGDAKQLYKDVKEGKETRVSLIKAETPEDQL